MSAVGLLPNGGGIGVERMSICYRANVVSHCTLYILCIYPVILIRARKKYRMTLLTLWHFLAQKDLVKSAMFQQIITERVKRVMCLSLNSGKEKIEVRLMRLSVKSEAK